jgi:hypothetical protein
MVAAMVELAEPLVRGMELVAAELVDMQELAELVGL